MTILTKESLRMIIEEIINDIELVADKDRDVQFELAASVLIEYGIVEIIE